MTTTNKKIRDSARMEDCTLRIPGVCNFNPETTVLAHTGSGTGKRLDDREAVYACAACHDAIDFRSSAFLSHDLYTQERLHRHRRAYIKAAKEKTHRLLLEKGLL